MYIPHPDFDTPKGNQIIWRYMNLKKIRSLLKDKAIWFARLDSFEDPFEGSFPKSVFPFEHEVWTRLKRRREQSPSEDGVMQTEIQKGFHPEPASDPWEYFQGLQLRQSIAEIPERQLRFVLNTLKVLSRRTFVSCWHNNRHESDAMWKLYLRNDEGVAIKSTVSRLIRCFRPTDKQVYIGRVRYRDFDGALKQPPTPTGAALLKRIAFRHEREVRAIILDNSREAMDPDSSNRGFLVTCDLRELMSEIRTSPRSNESTISALRDSLQKLGLDVPIRSSIMDEVPVW
jgi:hypothetical protein